jgi:hypothetical protein
MRQPRSLINKRVGDLVVKRDLGNDLFHCECLPLDRECGRYRTVSRARLTSKDIESCAQCATKNRKTAYLKRPPDPPLVIVEPARIPCRGCRVDSAGWLRISFDCPRHGTMGKISPAYAQRTDRQGYYD